MAECERRTQGRTIECIQSATGWGTCSLSPSLSIIIISLKTKTDCSDAFNGMFSTHNLHSPPRPPVRPTHNNVRNESRAPLLACLRNNGHTHFSPLFSVACKANYLRQPPARLLPHRQPRAHRHNNK